MRRFVRILVAAFSVVLGSAQAQTLQNGAFSSTSGNTTAVKNVTSNFTDGTTLTLTAAGSGSTSFFAGSTGEPLNTQTLAAIGNPSSTYYNPTIPTSSPAVKYTVQAGTCAPSSTGNICNRGTLTVSFSRSVTDPVMHISGIGGVAFGSGYDNRTQTIFTLTTAGVTLQSSGSPNNLSVSSTQATSSQLLSGSDCQDLNNNRGATAACGSVILKGTFTSVTFNVQIRSSTAVTSSTTTLSDDTTTLAFSIASAPASALTCSTTMYALMTNDSGNTYKPVYSLTPSGTKGSSPIYTFSGDSATLAVSPSGDRIYSATYSPASSQGTLRVFDVLSGQLVASQSFSWASGGNMLRMAVTSNGIGYMSTGDTLWAFDRGGNILAGYPKSLAVNSSTLPVPALSPVPVITGNGDFIADSEGNLYLIADIDSSNNYIDIFKVRSGGEAAFVGRVTGAALSGTGTGFGGMAALNGKIYASSTAGKVVEIDLISMTATQTSSAAANSNADLASCYYPTLAPQINAAKTWSIAAKGAGNTSANPQTGDTLEYKIVVRNSGTLNAVSAKFYDAIPAGTTYVANSTQMNFSAVTDSTGAVMPFAVTGGAPIKSPNRAARTTSDGAVYVDTTSSSTTSTATDEDDNEVVITFRVKIGTGVTSVSNQGVVTYLDGPTTGEMTDDPTTATPDDATVTVIPVADLTVTKTTPSGIVYPSIAADNTVTPAVAQQLRSITYTVTVTNSGAAVTSGTVTVTDTLPSGVSATAISGTGWTCALASLSCTRTDALAVGASYPVITVTVQSPLNTALETNASLRDFNNTATVGGGGQTNEANDTAVANVKVAYVKLSKQVRNATTGAVFATTSSGTPGQTLEYCINFVNYGGVALNNFKVTDNVPGNVAAVTTGYDAAEPSAATGFGMQLTRNGVVSYLTSASDATDKGTLTTSGGTYGSGLMDVTLPTALALAESSGVCFTATIR